MPIHKGKSFHNRKMGKSVNSNDTKSIFNKRDVEKALKMSNLGKIPKGTDGTMGMVGKKVKPIDMNKKGDIFNPMV